MRQKWELEGGCRVCQTGGHTGERTWESTGDEIGGRYSERRGMWLPSGMEWNFGGLHRRGHTTDSKQTRVHAKELNMLREWLSVLVLVTRIHSARPDFDEDLNELTNDMARKYFQEFKCVIYITDDNSKYTSNWSFLPTVVTITLTGNTQPLLEEIYNMDCKGFILRVVNRTVMVRNLIQAYKKSVFSRYNNKRYLFLPVDDGDNQGAFLEMEEMYYMPNLVFVVPADNSTRFEFHVHNYFDGHKYDVLHEKTEVVDAWYPGRGFENDEMLYPDKMRNMHGREMVLGMMQYSPYSLVIKEGDDVVYDGLETRIVSQYVDYVNATWSGKDHPVFLWGDIYENGTGNGILGSVYEHSADFGFAAIYQWHCDILDCSYPYLNAGVTCLVPRPQPLLGWYTIILPFEPDVWLAVFIIYCICSVFVSFATVIIQKIQRVDNDDNQSLLQIVLESFFTLFRIQIQQSLHDAGSNTALYSFFKICTVYCFFIVICWQDGISSFLTVPSLEDPIDDAVDLTSRWPKMQWGANHIDWTKSISQSTQPVTAQIARDFVVLDDEALKARMKLRNFGYFTERLPNGHYGLSDYIDEEGMKYLRIMKNNIYTANCVIVLPKCSPFSESLDKLLFWMFDTGLIQKLEIQVSLERINNRLQNMVASSSDSESPEDVALLVSHILGAIFVYCFGVGFSAVVFLAEIFYYRVQDKK